jgi:hypothetical protein
MTHITIEREKLKLVLGALFDAQTDDDSMEKWDRHKKAITVCEQALAAPAQPAQRTWVGLTKYEGAECWYGEGCLEQKAPFDGYAEAIEAKLKERNT